MRSFALTLIAFCGFAVEDAPRKLDPNVPGDAIKILDQITVHASWPGMDREQAVTMQIALQTVATVVAEEEKRKAAEAAAKAKEAEKPPEKKK